MQKPQIMGILNLTPDSFYDGGQYNSLDLARTQIGKMIEDGVDMIDVGGFSSRPGSVMPTVEEELERIIPVLDYLDTLSIDFSVDTCRSEVVKELLKYKNLKYINDISGLNDEKILDLIFGTSIGYILMHIKGTPENMQSNPEYDDLLNELLDFFEEKLKKINSRGIKSIVLDPGFGFGKTLEHNYTILKNLDKFKRFNLPILAGLSRKSMIFKALDLSPAETLSETTALNLYALTKGANILRVHDVREHKNILKLYELIKKGKK